jgi:hypothetical protein
MPETIVPNNDRAPGLKSLRAPPIFGVAGRAPLAIVFGRS